NPKLELGVGLVLKNIGLQITKYTPTGDRESLPFEIQAGITKKLPKAPLRLSLTLTNLQQPNLIYSNPYIPPPVDINGNPLPAKSTIADNVLSHIIFGTEILISRNFHLRAAYNHQRRNELKSINQSVGLTGFSFGFGLRVYRFGLDYAFSRYHVAGNVHHFSISTSLSDFSKK
ncbi:MAG: penicillin-binding protein, partial [Bacteroidia bacterium]|nr:penicillin-binding protein [Bacteroidia bacterium]